MGNVAVSEALRAHPANAQLISGYIACQSAEIAHTYDQDATPNENTSFIPDLYRFGQHSPRATPYSPAAGDNYHKGLATRSVTKFVNFANLGDAALGAWDINQSMKPDDGWLNSDTTFAYTNPHEIDANGYQTGNYRDLFYEDPPGTDPANQLHEIYWPAKRFTILAHIIPARSRATGATINMGGEFASQVDLNVFGSGNYSHSAAFLSNFAERRTFYFQLLTNFKLSPDPLNTP
jgi:hypothetical protein